MKTKDDFIEEPNDCAAALIAHNEWRRGKTDEHTMTPMEIGEMLDAAAELVGKIEVERSISDASDQHAASLEERLAKRMIEMQKVVLEKVALQNELRDIAVEIVKVMQLTDALNATVNQRDELAEKKWPIMGYGNVAIGGSQQADGLYSLLYMDMGETRPIDADTTDLFPIGAAVDPQKLLACVYFKDSAAIQQTIDVLKEMQGAAGGFDNEVMADPLQACPHCFTVFEAQPLDQEGGAA